MYIDHEYLHRHKKIFFIQRLDHGILVYFDALKANPMLQIALQFFFYWRNISSIFQYIIYNLPSCILTVV